MNKRITKENIGKVVIASLLFIIFGVAGFVLGVSYSETKTKSNDSDIQTVIDKLDVVTAGDDDDIVTKSVCIVEGEVYDHDEMFTNDDEKECTCINGSIHCIGGPDGLEAEDKEEAVDEAGDDYNAEDQIGAASDEITYKEIEFGLKYSGHMDEYAKFIRITVPEDTTIEEVDSTTLTPGKFLVLAPNATLSFGIPHFAFNMRYASVNRIEGSKIENLHSYMIPGQNSPDTYVYTDMVTLKGICDTPDGPVSAPCGGGELLGGVHVSCSMMAGGNKICDEAIKTMVIVD